MISRCFLTAFAVILTAVDSARADLVFEFRAATTLSQQFPGPIITSLLNTGPGSPNVILQISLRDTGATGAPSPTNPRILPYDMNGLGNGDQLTGWGFRLIAPTFNGVPIARHNHPVSSPLNTRPGMTAFDFGNVTTIGSDTLTFTQSTLRNTAVGEGAYEDGTSGPGQIPGVYVLCNIVVNFMNQGSGVFSIVDAGTSDDIGTLNTPSFDVAVFDQPFLLPVAIPIPEPSSMALVGVAIVGLGYSTRRKAVRVKSS